MNDRWVTFHVTGMPIPQGHVRAFARKGGGIQYAHGNKALATWRRDVRDQAHVAMIGADPWPDPVEVLLTFEMPRPLDHYGTGRNATRLKASAPAHVTTRPDIDRLARAVLDAISLPVPDTTPRPRRKRGEPPREPVMLPPAILLDDSQVVVLLASKRYVDQGALPGVAVIVSALEPDQQPLALVREPSGPGNHDAMQG